MKQLISLSKLFWMVAWGLLAQGALAQSTQTGSVAEGASEQGSIIGGNLTAPDKQTISLEPGESYIINTPFQVTKIAIGAPEVAEATRVTSTQILLNAVNNGQTNLLMWAGEELKVEYTIQVGAIDTAHSRMRALEDLFSDLEGLSFRIAGGNVVIEGEVYSDEELSKVEEVSTRFEGVVNLAKRSNIYNRLLAQEIQDTIGLPKVTVRESSNRFVVEGVVATDIEANYAIDIAKSFTDRIVQALYIDPSAFERQPLKDIMVEFDVKALQVTQAMAADLSHRFNTQGSVNFSTTSENRAFPDTNLGTALGISTDDLQKLEEDGKGRLLVEHTLIAQSGEPAKVFIGDEYPVMSTNENGAMNIDYVQVGLDIEILPRVYEGGVVETQVMVGSSQVSGAGIGGAPIINATKVSSTNKLTSGSTVVLAGMVRSTDRASYYGTVTDTGKQAIKRGSAFEASENYFDSAAGTDPNRVQGGREEVVLLVTPRVLQDARQAGQAIRANVENSFKRYDLERIEPGDSNRERQEERASNQ